MRGAAPAAGAGDDAVGDLSALQNLVGLCALMLPQCDPGDAVGLLYLGVRWAQVAPAAAAAFVTATQAWRAHATANGVPDIPDEAQDQAMLTLLQRVQRGLGGTP